MAMKQNIAEIVQGMYSRQMIQLPPNPAFLRHLHKYMYIYDPESSYFVDCSAFLLPSLTKLLSMSGFQASDVIEHDMGRR